MTFAGESDGQTENKDLLVECPLLFTNDGEIIRVAGHLHTFIWPIQVSDLRVTHTSVHKYIHSLYLYVTKMRSSAATLAG